MNRQITYADYQKLSDEELSHRYTHRQDRVAANFLFERYGHLILGIAFKHQKKGPAARHSTEQIFLKMLDGLQQPGIEKFKSWLFQFTNRFLSKNNTSTKYIQDPNSIASIAFKELHTPVGDETFDNAFNGLEEGQKKCLQMFYIDKMTYGEIGEKQGLSFHEVRNYLQEGRKNLQSKIERLEKTAAV